MLSLSLILGTSLIVSPFQESINAYWSSNLRDAKFVARVLQGSQSELQKINKDFGMSYRIKTTTVSMKEPFKLRLEGEVDDSRIVFVVNGTRKAVKVPRSNINIKESVAKSPGKRQTAFDFGIITPALFDGFLVSKFVRQDRATGDAVFDINFNPVFNDNTRFRVWLDKEKHVMTKREWYNRDGELMATFTYENFKQDAGVWLPTKVTVRNSENKVAGVTQYESLKVNNGLDDTLFKVD